MDFRSKSKFTYLSVPCGKDRQTELDLLAL